MLGLALLTRNAETATEQICRHLRAVVPNTIPLVLVDAASSDRTPQRLAQLAADSHALSVPLSRTECSTETVIEITRRLTGCRYVLVLRPEDRLVADQLPRLDAFLENARPDLAVFAAGWWLADPPHVSNHAVILPYPDATRRAALPQRPSADALLTLTPDPRHLLPATGASTGHDPFGTPAQAWQAWEDALKGQAEIGFFPEPVVLHPVPTVSAARAVATLRSRIAGAPRRDARADLLNRLAPWLGDALSLSPATKAADVARELTGLWAEMPRALRRAACALPGPEGGVFDALAAGELRAGLGFLATTRQELIVTHLAAEYRHLCEAVELALPGPDYLADLYARVRGL